MPLHSIDDFGCSYRNDCLFGNNIPGHVNDLRPVKQSKNIKQIVGKDLCISDPAFQSIPFVIYGLRKNQFFSQNDKVFYKVSRFEFFFFF
jgi:hypothetical protein